MGEPNALICPEALCFRPPNHAPGAVSPAISPTTRPTQPCSPLIPNALLALLDRFLAPQATALGVSPTAGSETTL